MRVTNCTCAYHDGARTRLTRKEKRTEEKVGRRFHGATPTPRSRAIAARPPAIAEEQVAWLHDQLVDLKTKLGIKLNDETGSAESNTECERTPADAPRDRTRAHHDRSKE